MLSTHHRRAAPGVLAAATLAVAALAAPSSAAAWSWGGSTTTTTTATTTTAAPAPTLASTATSVVGTATAVVAAATSVAPTSCADTPTTKSFAKWGDNADYSPAPNGTFEDAIVGWKLSSGASVKTGNETLGVATGSKSIQLGAGSTATSPQFCVSEANPHFRFTTKSNFWYSTWSALVLYRDAAGTLRQAQFVSSSGTEIFPGSWQISKVSPLATKIPLVVGGKIATVQILLKAGNGSTSFDSIMVDPYRRG